MRVLLAAFLITGLGCSGGGKADVSGKVRLDGAPLTSGSVTFVDANGVKKFSRINSKGEYHVRDLATGTMDIAVESHAFVPPGLSKPGAGIKPDDGAVKIPERYNDAKKSKLSVTVTGEGQKRDIDLTSE